MESLTQTLCSSNGGRFTLSLCVLNQWSLDFTGNTDRIIQSIKIAKRSGALYRLGPELELSGYGCEDHFHELDTYNHSWQCLSKILHETNTNDELKNIVCDIGMPILLGGVAYNCRVLLLNGRVIFIKPKLVLADGGLHRETRWFTPWSYRKKVVKFVLPSIIQQVSTDCQQSVPFGDAILRFNSDRDLSLQIGLETCEELWIGSPLHIEMYASGVDAVLNASASHHELRKLNCRIDLVKMASRSNGGGLYAYTNLRGCDSERICYDGCALAAVFGNIVCLTEQFGLGDVHVETITVDINELRSQRIADRSFGRSAAAAALMHSVEDNNFVSTGYPVVEVNFSLCQATNWSSKAVSPIENLGVLSPEEEIARGPTLWLWDMLRRSKSSGFFLCLSGGLDSASVACLVFCLCYQICEAMKKGISPVAQDCRRILGESDDFIPKNARELCHRLFTTCYLETENSSKTTKLRAQTLADYIGSNHLQSNISPIISEVLKMASQTLNLTTPPRYTVEGGTNAESLALQNVQARTRMISAYLLAQLIPWKEKLPSGLLVLSSANLDEGLRGYLTKYDCSSADLNPIGSISKMDLRQFMAYCAQTFPKYMDSDSLTAATILIDILGAQPSAELMPLGQDGNFCQLDDVEMGISYDELSLFGRLRKISNCGPLSMLQSVLGGEWIQIKHKLPKECLQADGMKPTKLLASYVCDKVKLFFKYYAINRHKLTVLPPAYHAEPYNTDDNRFDLRPLLYPADWSHQFKCLDQLVSKWINEFETA